MRRLALLALPLLLVACQGEPETTASSETTIDGETVAAVEATGPWCRPTPNGRNVTACYITLTSATGDRLVAVISPRAAQSQIHAVSTEGGVMSMSEMPDGPERDALFLQAKRIVVTWMPYKTLVHRISTDMLHPWVSGYRRPLFWQEWWHMIDVDPALRQQKTGKM